MKTYEINYVLDGCITIKANSEAEALEKFDKKSILTLAKNADIDLVEAFGPDDEEEEE